MNLAFKYFSVKWTLIAVSFLVIIPDSNKEKMTNIIWLSCILYSEVIESSYCCLRTTVDSYAGLKDYYYLFFILALT